MVLFKVGPAPNGCRWARTEGLAAYGQHEMALPLTWNEGNWRDDQAKTLLSFIGSYIYIQPQRISPSETMRYGWSSLQAVSKVAAARGDHRPWTP